MFRLGAVSLGVATAASSWKEIVDEVNAGNNGWVAHAPSRFENVDDVAPYLGGILPGEAGFEEPDVVTLPPTNGDLPASFDSLENWPNCPVIGAVHDQSTCGSCWAFASSSSFEGRRCIATGDSIKFSPEDTAFCQPFFGAGHGCNGGNSAWKWFVSHGVVTGGDHFDTEPSAGCLPYSFAPCAHHVPATADYPACGAEGGSPKCGSACSESSYAVSYKQDKHHAAHAYSIKGVTSIQQDLVENGPLFVSFRVYADFPTYKSGVYRKTSASGKYLGGHAVTLVGYGTLDGDDFWKIKNSWNAEWGDHGYFKMLKGVNELGVEANVNGGNFASSVSV